MTTTSEGHAAREAEIRQRIAEEVREAHYQKYCDGKLFTDYKTGELSGIAIALRIIERGGAQPEGEHNGSHQQH